MRQQHSRTTTNKEHRHHEEDRNSSHESESTYPVVDVRQECLQAVPHGPQHLQVTCLQHVFDKVGTKHTEQIIHDNAKDLSRGYDAGHSKHVRVLLELEDHRVAVCQIELYADEGPLVEAELGHDEVLQYCGGAKRECEY